jgi:glycosyltransferase involved in cell wall biosynthesis
MKPMGGSEIVYNNIIKYVKNIDKINLIMSICDFGLLDPNKPNVVYQELSYDQDNVQLMANPEFKKAVDHFVFVSHWQYEKFRTVFNIPEHKCTVIRNAIDPIEFKDRGGKKDKLKLIYTSTPWRGLNVLLKSFELLNRDDVELHIYSSVKIYGDSFEKQTQQQYQPLFNKAKAMNNVIYHGYETNEEIRKALMECHIFAYPSIFEETSCISAIEAGASGLHMVCSNYGALYETCACFADYIMFNPNLNQMAENYSKKLNTVIDKYWSINQYSDLEFQSDYFNDYYSWERRIVEWEFFIDQLCL